MIPDPFRSLTLRLPSSIVIALKAHCAAEDMTMQKYVCQVLTIELAPYSRKKRRSENDNNNR